MNSFEVKNFKTNAELVVYRQNPLKHFIRMECKKAVDDAMAEFDKICITGDGYDE